MAKQNISFSKWTIDDVVENLGIEVSYMSEGMEYWLDYTEKPTQMEIETLKRLSLQLRTEGNSWNESELEIFFLSPLLLMVNYNSIGVKTYVEREIKAVVNNIELSGVVDWIVSRGKGRPQVPYFCIKEFKKVKNSSNDPEGQLAAAMVAAQALNNNENTIYGAYLLGREWIFCTLKGKNFVQSQSYLGTEEQGLIDIFMIMKNLKNIILKQVTEI
jgi:hypothetical protein